MTDLATCSWGGLRLEIEEVGAERGRKLVTHNPSRGNEYIVQDRGKMQEGVRAEVVFCEVEWDERSYVARANEFLDLVDKGVPQLFVHPTRGSFRAAIGQCTETIAAGAEEMRYQVEFVPVSQISPVQTVGAGVTPIAGPEAVATAEANALEHLDTTAQGASVAAIANASTVATGWQDNASDARTVLLEMTDALDRIDQAIETDGLAELENWQAYREVIAVRTQLREAARAAIRTEERIRTIDVKVPAPLLMICARIYGASEARARADQVASMNDLRDRSLVPAGTRLRLPIARARA